MVWDGQKRRATDYGAPSQPDAFQASLPSASQCLLATAPDLLPLQLVTSASLGQGRDRTHPSLLGVNDLLAAYAAEELDPYSILGSLRARAQGGEAGSEPVLCLVPGAGDMAAESAERYRSGTARPLEGIAFGIEDMIDVAGTRVTSGSWLTGDRVAAQDAACVARLRAAGAIPAFMLATTDFACGGPQNPRYGSVPNPWDRRRWTGGGGCGVGAALASRIVPLALGTDAAGALRIPAAVCGVTGFKPTRGLVPRTGVTTVSWTLDHAGAVARSCADIARIMPILAGPDGADPAALPHAPDFTLRSSLEGVRLGVPGGWFTERCDGAVLTAWSNALDVLAEAGAILVPVNLPDIALSHAEAWLILHAEFAAGQESRLGQQHQFDPLTSARIRRGMEVRATDYLRALRRRPLIQHMLLEALDAVDVLVTPGVGAEAPLLAEISVEIDGATWPLQDVATRNTMLFDYTGFPALMVPAGFGRTAMPLGMQIAGRPLSDALCLSVGHHFQMRTGFHHAHPQG